MKTIRILLSLVGAAALAVAARATIVTLNTSSLAGGTYYVDFQLNDGNGVGDGNNTAVIKDFAFGGGAATGSAVSFGGVTGDLTSGISMIDTDAFNEVYQSFTAGSFLRFNVFLSNHINGLIPDVFGFAILDENLFNVATFSAGTDQFLAVNLNGDPLTFETYAGKDGLAAPDVPETGSTALFASFALLGLAGFRRTIRASRRAA